MSLATPSPRPLSRRFLTRAGGLILLLGLLSYPLVAQQARKLDVLRIGTSGTLALDASGEKQAAAQDTLKSFIKSETGFENEILPQKDWEELAEKLAGGQLHLGVFQGYEFAWAKEKYPNLQPLAVAVNVHPYRDAHVVVRQDNRASDFASLQGQALALPRVGQGQLGLFLERQSLTHGKAMDGFFARLTNPDNVEDALDDVVDGVVGAAVVDRVALEAYKRRKPGRFNRLKEVAHSQAFPPPLVASYDNVVDQATRKRFQDGLLNARRKERGQRLLTLFKLTGFETAPANFQQMVAETQKAYPPPNRGMK